MQNGGEAQRRIATLTSLNLRFQHSAFYILH